ncbi:translationally-controlled tumor protein [Streptomyces griseus]|uniref:translationally-controlled tumor protein n=1 Tax=Streptomyces griseus TaxID=1911 RepID=UPI0033C39011
MTIYKDIVTGDELLSDSHPIKEDGVCYVVEGTYVTRSSGSVDIGSTSEVAGADEGDAGSATVLNVVDAYRLIETRWDLKSYSSYMNVYLKRVVAAVPADERPVWREQMQKWFQEVKADFGSYRFFLGESNDSEAMTVLMKTGEDGETPFFYYLRHGLKAEAS